MSLSNFFQKEDWQPRLGARMQDFGSALQGVQGGNLQAYNQGVERDERRSNIAALMDNMGIGGNRRALLDMLPQDGQVSSLYDMLGQQDAAAAQNAATARFNAFLGAGGQPQQGAPITSGPIPIGNPQGLPQSIVDAVNGGGVDAYNSGLSTTESGGNYGIVNSEGYGGRYQFGQARLTDYNRATGQNVTMEQFLASPQIQEAAQRWNVSDTDQFIQGNGLNQYIGQTINGVTITQNGMRAMAHLGGNHGMKRFLESGGTYNPADSNGTHLSDYAATHAGGQPQGQPPHAPPNERLMQLFQLANDPNLSDGQRAYANAMIKQEMAQPKFDPNRWKVVGGRLVDLAAEGGPSVVDGIEPPVDTSAPKVQTLTRSDGSDVAVQWSPDANSPQGGTWVPIDAPEGGGTAPSQVDLTADQSKLTLFKSMMDETAPVLGDIETQWDPSNISDAVARNTPIAGNFFQSSAGQTYTSAASAWAEGALRISTGAAATPSEIVRIRETYFAQPGDTPTTIAFKSQMRGMYNRSIQRALGHGDVTGSLVTPEEFAGSVGGMSIDDALALGGQ